MRRIRGEGGGGRRGGQICEVERVHVRRMRGGGGEVKYVRWRESM